MMERTIEQSERESAGEFPISLELDEDRASKLMMVLIKAELTFGYSLPDQAEQLREYANDFIVEIMEKCGVSPEGAQNNEEHSKKD